MEKTIYIDSNGGENVIKGLILPDSVKALPTVKSASGTIATFDTDLTENLIECICDIQYQQASGTPTPSSPLPITTFNACNLSVMGENLCEEVFEQGTISSGGVIDPSATALHSKNFNPCTPNTIYRGYLGTTGSLLACWYDKSQNFISRSNNIANQNRTSPSNAYFFKITTDSSYGTTYNDNIAILYPSSLTTYKPYNGQTYNIPFGQTVVKGTLNVTTGKLMVTWEKCVLSDLSWSYSSSGYFYSEISDKAIGNTNIICDSYATSSSTSASGMLNNEIKGREDNKLIYLKDSRYTTASDLTTNMGNSVIIYELATPIEIQLSSNQVQTLLNQNNIWCDTNGDTSVKYLLTVGKAVSE